MKRCDCSLRLPKGLNPPRIAALAAAALALLVAAAGAAAAPGEDPGILEHWERGMAALEAKDPKAARVELEKAAAGLPRHAEILYALAKADALTGDASGALGLLRRVVAMGYGAGAATDPAFGSLSGMPEFRALLPAIARNGKPVGTAAVAFTLPESDLIPEGIAWNPSNDSFFLGSLSKRKIVAIARDGTARDFVTSGRDGLGVVLGMKVDAARGSLWACTADPDAPGGNPARRSVLVRFDLKSGRTLERISAPEGGRHLFNDLAVAKNGEIYLTDSEDGGVFRLAPGAKALERFAPAGTLFYPNGIALSDDGRFLYVAHEGGLVAWELARGRSFPVPAPDDVALGGIDGLSFWRGSLVAVQNGLEPARIVLFPLAASLDRVTGARVLERGNTRFEIPTTGAVAGDAYYVIANSQLRALAPDGIVKDPERLHPVVILKLALPR